MIMFIILGKVNWLLYGSLKHRNVLDPGPINEIEGDR